MLSCSHLCLGANEAIYAAYEIENAILSTTTRSINSAFVRCQEYRSIYSKSYVGGKHARDGSAPRR